MTEVLGIDTASMETMPVDFIIPGSRVTIRFSDDDTADTERFIITDSRSQHGNDASFAELSITSPLGMKIKHLRAGEAITFRSARSGEVGIEIIAVDNFPLDPTNKQEISTS